MTTNIKQIRSIPLSAKFSEYGLQQVEIRGEVLINKSNFANYNQQLVEQGLPPLANPAQCRIRNTAYQRFDRSKKKKPGGFCISY
ncbi:MAG: hypothetical protein WDO71_07170 [Bacteroidota bacterium]